MTKIDIFSGFLGAGKTTLIKKLIEEAFKGEKLVLIENEFGEIGIDGGFLKDAGVEITEMNSGCICCSLVGDFGTALKEVLEKYNPDRIIIEPSGVGKLSDVIKAVQGVTENADVTLNSFVTVADASKYKMYMKNFKEFFSNQIEYAKTIILSRTQKVSQEKLEASLKEIRNVNKDATIITTPWEEISGLKILEAIEDKDNLKENILKEEHEHHHNEKCSCGHNHDHNDEEECSCGHEHHHDKEESSCGHDHHHDKEECSCGHDHHHDKEECSCGHEHHHNHDADDVFTSWGVETVHRYSEKELDNILNTLANTEEYGTILRAKGIVQSLDGQWLYYDLVPQEYEIRKGSADYTGRICVIGSNLDKQNLQRLFTIE